MELLTVDETAKLLKVNPMTVRRYISDGRLPAVKVGRRVRVRKEALEAFLLPSAPRRQEAGTHSSSEPGNGPRQVERVTIPHLTADDLAHARVAIVEARRVRARMLVERGGARFPSSLDLINAARDDRTHDLAW